MQAVTFASHETSFVEMSSGVACQPKTNAINIYSLCGKILQLTRVACNADNFLRSSEPRFAMARVVSVMSWLRRLRTLVNSECHSTSSQIKVNAQALPKRCGVLSRAQLIHKL